MTNVLLWLDDVRNPFENDWLIFSPIVQPFETVWVKSYFEFKNWIISNGLPDGICFDHDLGEDKNGYDCAKWLVDYCMNRELQLPEYNIQSANPVGKDNINGLFKSFTKNVKYA